ncbi:hypothetical protein T265_01555 [Opisthorchis viverrini]|uniref:RRM domain-containing protein n=1 Tax=Opisthorchis viverrini TaxID=6198 RepID=A0A074ZZ18_OPIVI|nr:hypothetical protein T265_01555 [Opisthorchis viverrini]KER32326.1 hypothetical protein T265_01555 [Opisthorchis viverrini]
MPLTDVNQVTASLNTLQLREVPALSSNSVNHLTPSRQAKAAVMSASTGVLGRQGNQNAAALPPEEGIGKPRESIKYSIVQENGQRRYGPPRNWRAEPPPRGCEVFIGKIPRDCFEEELIPVFEQIGPIYMFRLMMEFNGTNRGYGFCVYTNREDTKKAVQTLDNYEIRKGKTIGVCFSVDNCRLFVGGIPKNKTREEIMVEMRRVTEGVKDVISYPSVTDKSKNRGFAFVEYESHKAAAMARRKLMPGKIQLWNQQIAVDWAEPEREVNEDIMSKVKILYVRNLMLSTTEDGLREHFVCAAGGDPNCIERVKKISDYAFIHFKEREQAARCLEALNDTLIDGSKIEVTWAKPVDKTEANARQQSNSGKLLNDLALGKDIRANNPLLLDPRANAATLAAVGGFMPHLDPAISFLLPPVGQQPVASDILSINPSALIPPGAGVSVGSPGGPRLNGTRMGRRNAAGSRSAGIQRDRKHPVEKLQQRQLNPFSYFEILEEQSRLAGWGPPNFSVLPVELVDGASGNKLQLYIGQVALPNLGMQCQTNRCYATPEEAKHGACEVALSCLQFSQLMSLDDTIYTPVRESTFASCEGLLSASSLVPATTQALQVQIPVGSVPTLAVPGSQFMFSSGTYPNVHTTAITTPMTSSPSNLNTASGQESVDTSGRSETQVTPTSVGSTVLCPFGTTNSATQSTGQLETVNTPGQDLPSTSAACRNVVRSRGLICTQPTTLVAIPGLTPSPVMYPPSSAHGLGACAGLSMSQKLNNPTQQQIACAHLHTVKSMQTPQLATIQPINMPQLPALAANYALTLGSNMMQSGTTLLPIQNGNNALGLLQPQTSNLSLTNVPGQTIGQQAVGLRSPPECASALALNGFDYPSTFIPGSIAAAGLIAPFTNSPTYLLDPNGISAGPAPAMMVGTGGNMPGLQSIVSLPQAPVSCSTELAQNSCTISTSHLQHTGLYNLGLHTQTILSNPSQPNAATLSNNANSLLGLLGQTQPSVTIPNANVTLSNQQPMANHSLQTGLSVSTSV